MTTTKPTPTEIATEILDLAGRYGLTVTADREILTVSATFEPGDRLAYIRLEGDANSILARAPMNRPGSVWGTDSASIGGHAGLTGGYVRMNKSGVAKRVLNAIKKAQS